VDGDVPEKDKIVFSLDMGALIAGAKGEFEERLKSVVKVTAAEGDIVLLLMRFTLVGAGGGMDAANILSFGSWRTARYWCNHLR
jgi:ATP-dependent Clp protease ATP-binding subunit ClpA